VDTDEFQSLAGEVVSELAIARGKLAYIATELHAGARPSMANRVAALIGVIDAEGLWIRERLAKSRSEERPDAHATTLEKLLVDLVDPDPCRLDHHGFCQAHGWFTNDRACPHMRARDLLDDKQ
jgi:hypothetical protein